MRPNNKKFITVQILIDDYPIPEKAICFKQTLLSYPLICNTSIFDEVKAFWAFSLHVVHKEGVVSSCRYNPNFDLVFWIPVQKLVIHIYLKRKFTTISFFANLMMEINNYGHIKG